MTDEEYIISKSQDYSKTYCPGCLPTLDPLTDVWVVCYCREHEPTLSGAQDQHTPQTYIPLIGSVDMDGHSNRAWCNFFHRGEV